jgi:hypothetical protein
MSVSGVGGLLDQLADATRALLLVEQRGVGMNVAQRDALIQKAYSWARAEYRHGTLNGRRFESPEDRGEAASEAGFAQGEFLRAVLELPVDGLLPADHFAVTSDE